MSRLNDIALRRLNCGVHTGGEKNIFQGKVLAFELGQFGFKLNNLDAFTSISRAAFEARLDVLKAMRGSDVDYVPLFLGFPDDLPNDEDYLIRRILVLFWGENAFRDKTRFGADPATQMQRPDLWAVARQEQAKRLADSQVEWITLSLVSPVEATQRLVQWASALIYGATPIKEALWDDVFAVMAQADMAIAVEKIVIKETLARLAANQWQRWSQLIVRTPTDLLRMFAFMREQDVSLAAKVDLKGLRFSKPQRREIMAFLNQCPALAEDLWRYKRLWISLSRWLHPGDYVKRFPVVVKAFDDLRNDRMTSFESGLMNASVDERMAILRSRPSLLLRKLTWLLKETAPAVVVDALIRLQKSVESLPLPLLLSAYCALDYTGSRVIINKQGKPYTVGARGDLGDISAVLEALEALILEKLRGTKDWTKVWIDPAIYKLVLPLQARRQSDGLLNLARGSRIALTAEVIRLFVYWQQSEEETDLDLSAMQLDADFQFVSYISWSHYGEGADLAHSGDIQNAPRGAAEFMDIKLSAIASAYILPAVLRYEGEPFPMLQACYAGWMNRQQVGTDMKTFDPRTVAQKVAVNQSGKLWIPFMVDVVARELVMVDLYTQGARTVEHNEQFPRLAAGVANYWQAKPTFGALAHWYARANGARLVGRNDATTTIGLSDDCDINVLALVGQGVTSF